MNATTLYQTVNTSTVAPTVGPTSALEKTLEEVSRGGRHSTYTWLWEVNFGGIICRLFFPVRFSKKKSVGIDGNIIFHITDFFLIMCNSYHHAPFAEMMSGHSSPTCAPIAGV